jgi:hypothetical protein
LSRRNRKVPARSAGRRIAIADNGDVGGRQLWIGREDLSLMQSCFYKIALTSERDREVRSDPRSSRPETRAVIAPPDLPTTGSPSRHRRIAGPAKTTEGCDGLQRRRLQQLVDLVGAGVGM